MRTRGDDVVIERVPLNVQHRTLVTTHTGSICIYSTSLLRENTVFNTQWHNIIDVNIKLMNVLNNSDVKG
jgi:hypothetical protein